MGPRLLVALAVVALVATGCRDLGPGGADTGNKTSTVVYRVAGSGTADVRYAATATAALTMKRGVSLPWTVTVTTTDHSGTTYRVRATGSGVAGCSITVNDVLVRTEQGSPSDCSFVK